jgi:hypothetical protein
MSAHTLHYAALHRDEFKQRSVVKSIFTSRGLRLLILVLTAFLVGWLVRGIA